MGKRKLTISVDEELSDIVNTALATEVDRRARAAALERLLSDWEAELGPVPERTAAAARNAFDEI